MEGLTPPKFDLKKYSSSAKCSNYKQTYNIKTQKCTCICDVFNQNKVIQCFRCDEKIHICVKVQMNRPTINKFQCLSCLARNMDLVYQPRNILLQTFYRIENIFHKTNEIVFQFDLKYEELSYPVDIRGFKGNKIDLVWPMQGEFYLNGSQYPVNSLKPLKSNSNRKNRKQDPFTVRPQFLKQGKNILIFKIPLLDQLQIKRLFQYQETGVYFLGIYSIQQLRKQQLVTQTLKRRRHQKSNTLNLIRQRMNQDLLVQTQKVKFIDPYTCERITFPVRGKYCTHLTAICLLNFVMIQKNTRIWRCPICNSPLNQPYVDLWMYEMLKQNKTGESVYIHLNGTYQWEQAKQKVYALDSSEQDKQKQILSEKMDSNHIKEGGKNNEQPYLKDYTFYQFPLEIPDRFDQHNNDQQRQNIKQKDVQIGLQYQEPQHMQLQQKSQILKQIIEDSNDHSNIFVEDFPFQNQYTKSQKLENAQKLAQQKQKSQNILKQKRQIEKRKIQTLKNNSTISPKDKISKQTQLNVVQQNSQYLNKSNQSSKNLLQLQKLRQNIAKNKNSEKIKQILNVKKQKQQNNYSKEFFSKDKIFEDNKRRIHRPIQSNQSSLTKKTHNIFYSMNFQPSFVKSISRIKPQNALSNKMKIQRVQNNVPAISGSNKLKNELILKVVNQKSISGIQQLKFKQISHNKFIKRYYQSPLNPYNKLIKEDMKKLFQCIL